MIIISRNLELVSYISNDLTYRSENHMMAWQSLTGIPELFSLRTCSCLALQLVIGEIILALVNSYIFICKMNCVVCKYEGSPTPKFCIWISKSLDFLLISPWISLRFHYISVWSLHTEWLIIDFTQSILGAEFLFITFIELPHILVRSIFLISMLVYSSFMCWSGILRDFTGTHYLFSWFQILKDFRRSVRYLATVDDPLVKYVYSLILCDMVACIH